jgi:hypothetical protein
MTDDTPTVWIDILSDPAVRLAARAWHKDLPETWGILSRAIRAEQISQIMPLTQFDSYIAIVVSAQTSPPQIQPDTTPVPSPVKEQENLLVLIGNLIYIFGGSLAFINSLYVAFLLFGWVNALVGLVLAPVTYLLLPFYTFLVLGDPTLLIFNYGVGVTAYLLTYIGSNLNKKLTPSTIIVWGGLCAIALFSYGWVKDTYLPPPVEIQPTQKPTFTPSPQPPPTLHNPFATSTPNTSCLNWSQVTPAMEGETTCVFGVVSFYAEDWQNELTRLYFGSTNEFFFVSNYRWTTPLEGECITATGTILLNTYDVPYIKINDQIDFCQ